MVYQKRENIFLSLAFIIYETVPEILRAVSAELPSKESTRAIIPDTVTEFPMRKIIPNEKIYFLPLRLRDFNVEFKATASPRAVAPSSPKKVAFFISFKS